MINIIFGYSDTYMPFLALIAFFIVRKDLEKPARIFIIYLFVNIVLFGISNIMADVYRANNLFLYHFYYLFELLFIGYYITRYLIKSFAPLYYIIAGSYVVFWLLDVILWEPLDAYSSYAAGLEKIIILLLCMYYILMLSKSDDILNFQKLPGFWIASAFLVSSAIGILSVIAYKYYVESNLHNPGISAWIIESIGTIIKFTFIIVAFLCYRHLRRSRFQSPILL